MFYGETDSCDPRLIWMSLLMIHTEPVQKSRVVLHSLLVLKMWHNFTAFSHVVKFGVLKNPLSGWTVACQQSMAGDILGKLFLQAVFRHHKSYFCAVRDINGSLTFFVFSAKKYGWCFPSPWLVGGMPWWWCWAANLVGFLLCFALILLALYAWRWD